MELAILEPKYVSTYFSQLRELLDGYEKHHKIEYSGNYKTEVTLVVKESDYYISDIFRKSHWKKHPLKIALNLTMPYTKQKCGVIHFMMMRLTKFPLNTH